MARGPARGRPGEAARRASGLTWAAAGSPRSARTKAGAAGRPRAPRWRAPGTRAAARPPAPPRAGAAAASPAAARPPGRRAGAPGASKGRPALAREEGPEFASRSPAAPRPHGAARGPECALRPLPPSGQLWRGASRGALPQRQAAQVPCARRPSPPFHPLGNLGEPRARTRIPGRRHRHRVRAGPRPLGTSPGRPRPERLWPLRPSAVARVPERAPPPVPPTLRAAPGSPARAPPPARGAARALERAGPAPCPARPPPCAAPPAPGSLPGPGRHFPPKLPRKFATGRRRQERTDLPSPSAGRGSPDCMGAGRTGPGG